MVSCQSILGKFTKLGSWKSQRRGWVASPVGIWSGLKISGKSIAFRRPPPAGRNAPARPVYSCALSQNSDRAHYPRYSTIRGNFQIVAIYKDFKEISSDNVTTILESPATDSPFSVLQNFPFAERTISRSNPGYACSQSPVKAQRTVRS